MPWSVQLGSRSGPPSRGQVVEEFSYKLGGSLLSDGDFALAAWGPVGNCDAVPRDDSDGAAVCAGPAGTGADGPAGTRAFRARGARAKPARWPGAQDRSL